MVVTVVVDAWHLGGHSANRGIGTYLRNVLGGLASREEFDVVALAVTGTDLPAGVIPYRIRRLAPGRFAQREHEARLSGDLARAAQRTNGDLVLSPADDPPRRSPRPWVQMLHDLIPLLYPDPAFRKSAERWRKVGPRLRAANAILTNSRQTAADATTWLGIDSSRIHVAPLGVSPSFCPGDPRMRTDPPTIAYVGEYGPHKGFEEAFAVIGRLADAGYPHRLSMGGLLAEWHQPVVERLRMASPACDRIDLLGYVDDIRAVYRGADALIVTSRYEGFCLPALEAMACGTPVVAFANSAISEVVGDGGVLVPDGDVEAMAAALRTILSSDAEWQAWSEAGVAHARTFRWQRCVDVHAEVLRTVAGAA